MVYKRMLESYAWPSPLPIVKEMGSASAEQS